jgi:hypothetical protein
MIQEARIYSLANVGGQAVLVLEEVNGPRLLPVWIGLYEGGSIGMALAGQKFPRPLTHDLMLDAVRRLGAKLEKMVITGPERQHVLRVGLFETGRARGGARRTSVGFHRVGGARHLSDFRGRRCSPRARNC